MVFSKVQIKHHFFAMLFVQVVFFDLYYRFLDIKISWSAVFFILGFVLIEYLILKSLGSRIIKMMVGVVWSVGLVSYCLVNFVYYKVFHTFWSFNTAQVEAVDKTVLNLLSTYLGTVPFYVYVMVLLFFVYHIFFCVKVSSGEVPNKLRTVAALVAVGLFFGQIWGVNYLVIGRLGDSYTKQRYLSGLGVYGYLVDEYLNVKKVLSAPDDVVIPKEDAWGILSGGVVNQEINNQTGRVAGVKTGLPHVIFYQLESVANWPVDTVMPYLKKMMQQNISAEHFFANSCSTINAEFSVLCSFYPPSSGPVSDLYTHNQYYCLPSVLKDRYAYKTYMYHSNSPTFWHRDVLAKNWGIDELWFTPHYQIRTSDDKLINDVIQNIKNSKEPTLNYVIGFTSHGPHNQDFIEANYYDNNLSIAPYEGELSENLLKAEANEETIRNYFGFLKQIDDFIQSLFEQLGENNLLDNVIVVVYGDHKYYNFSQSDKEEGFLQTNVVPFFIYEPNGLSDKAEVASQVDIAPTVLNLIEGDRYSKPSNFVGQSLLAGNFSNSALNKCFDQDFYIDQDLIIEGTNDFDLYGFVKKKQEVNSTEKIARLRSVVAASDEIIQDDNLTKGSVASNDQSLPVLYINGVTDGDNDGLSDLYEENLGTDPYNCDSDGDSYMDGVEVMTNCDPLNESLICKDKKIEIISSSVLIRNGRAEGIKVAHALGEIDGHTATNSLEAFEHNYNEGIRFFEADLLQTKDGHIVLSHDLNLQNNSLAEIRKVRLDGKYRILEFSEFLEMLRQYTDAQIILDIKDDFNSTMSKVVEYSELYPDVFVRLIPQVYGEKDINFVPNLYNFNDIVLTLYKYNEVDISRVVEIVKNSPVTAVASWWDKKYEPLKDELNKLNVGYFVHTVNNKEDINKLINSGIGVYTDNVD